MTAAFMIEDGKITAPLRDCNLIGNGPEVLQRVDAVATRLLDDARARVARTGRACRSGTGQATMRLTGVTIGGAAA